MNPGRARRVFWWGLAASVLLHLSLLSGAWFIPPVLIHGVEEQPPIIARLVSTPPPPPPPSVKPVAKVTPPKPVQAPAPPPPPRSLPEPIESLPDTPDTETNAATAEPDEPQPELIEQPVVSEMPPGPLLNPLPNRVRLEYRARIGLATGQMTLLWVDEGEHYTITSILSPQGMASLFFSGQLVQMSRGRIVATGLQPEEFWDQRDNKRSQSRFNYSTQTILTESSKGSRTFPLPEGLQDAQSLLFQLALTAPPVVESDHAVFNGKKVRSYRYRLIGEESLDTPFGALRTLHIARVTDARAERFEIWLAVDRYYLPVKLATEISGYDAELLLYGMNTENHTP